MIYQCIQCPTCVNSVCRKNNSLTSVLGFSRVGRFPRLSEYQKEEAGGWNQLGPLLSRKPRRDDTSSLNKGKMFLPVQWGTFSNPWKATKFPKHRFSVMILNWRQIHWMQAQLWSWMRAMATETVAAVNRGMQLEKMSDAAHRNDEFLNRAFR